MARATAQSSLSGADASSSDRAWQERWRVAQALGMERYLCEGLVAFVRRRGRRAAAILDRGVASGLCVARLACALDQKVVGGLVPISWAALLPVRDAWLREQRIRHGPATVYDGRVANRAATGRVNLRWNGGLPLEKQQIRCLERNFDSTDWPGL